MLMTEGAAVPGIKMDESELLLKFEKDNLPADYKDYYVTKRQNLFASIQAFPGIWHCFVSLDKIWLREIDDVKTVRDMKKMFPLILFLNAHAKSRIAFELGLSACLTEAYSILRDAIESIAHGHRILVNPDLLKIWLDKNDGKLARDAYNKEFWNSKEERLFEGLDELHGLWKRYSEHGSHTNINSIVSRFVMEEDATTLTWKLMYTGLSPRILGPALFELLLAFHYMERVMFKDFEDRLKLDVSLVDMRVRFDHDKEAMRRNIIKVFGIKPPAQHKSPTIS
jgi:hypothetical protein